MNDITIQNRYERNSHFFKFIKLDAFIKYAHEYS
jgi:hypothetical protein